MGRMIKSTLIGHITHGQIILSIKQFTSFMDSYLVQILTEISIRSFFEISAKRFGLHIYKVSTIR